ncbi:RHS repeat-associated core domain-containing protein [Prevotella sp. KH2C16]|uniref:RHS repeat-associated core domain-containing protein n=1 Tax=Prevotella sp. KH2C16 TaxID=1855325 RepID=UPI0008E64969|nr:RHS repeat-associated core domain-containing protein [Prevotella sp. KH2C16]
MRTDYYINPLPDAVPQVSGGTGTAGNVDLRHIWTDYCGNFVYENDSLKQTLVEGGYISYAYPQGTSPANQATDISQLTPTYHFYVRDHLGNNRLVVDEHGAIEQVNHYYPFGGLMGESQNFTSTQRYKYNGKELDRMHGLDWYDYGARMYDASIGRWMSMDPLAEKYYHVSPYAYCLDNPVSLIDPDGMRVDWYKDKDDTFQYSPNVHSQKDLAQGQRYIGKSFKSRTHRGIASYRSDGSILFSNETDGYSRMWNQADKHYRYKTNGVGREVGGFVLSNNQVLVLPDYLNDDVTTKMDVGGYKLIGGTLRKGNERFVVIGQVHTHQDGMSTPSYYIPEDNSYGDLGYSKNNGSLPVFTIGNDGQIHGIRGYTDVNGQVIGLPMNLMKRDSSRSNLLQGKTTLSDIIKRLPKIVK